MYLVKGSLADGTRVAFQTGADTLSEAAQDLIAALSDQENKSPITKVVFTRKDSETVLKLKPKSEDDGTPKKKRGKKADPK